jgi:hypothetical protein
MDDNKQEKKKAELSTKMGSFRQIVSVRRDAAKKKSTRTPTAQLTAHRN